MVRLTDRPDMTLDVYRGRKTILQQYNREFLQICIVGLLLFALDISGTSIFKILVRTLIIFQTFTKIYEVYKTLLCLRERNTTYILNLGEKTIKTSPGNGVMEKLSLSMKSVKEGK